MHWSLWIIIAGIINAVVNTGYKVNAARENVFLFGALVMAVASLSLFSYVAATKGIRIGDVIAGKTNSSFERFRSSFSKPRAGSLRGRIVDPVFESSAKP